MICKQLTLEATNTLNPAVANSELLIDVFLCTGQDQVGFYNSDEAHKSSGHDALRAALGLIQPDLCSLCRDTWGAALDNDKTVRGVQASGFPHLLPFSPANVLGIEWGLEDKSDLPPSLKELDK